MSAKINETSGQITLTRGDSLWATSKPFYDDEEQTPYEKQEHDVVRFALKSAQMLPDGSDFVDNEPLFTRDLDWDSTHEYWVLHLVPGDTAELPFGNYRYDIELSTNWDAEAQTPANVDVYTYIANKKFKLTPEVE